MSDKAGAEAGFPEWEVYVQEVRDGAAGREADYIRPLVKGWTSAGRGQFKSLSPLREEKTASFYVYVGKGFWDFGSQQGGDLLKFVQLYRRGSWRETVDDVARFLGIDDWETRKKGGRAPAQDPAELLRRWHEPFPEERVFGCTTWLVHFLYPDTPTTVVEHLVDHYGYPLWFIERERVTYVPSDLWDRVHAPGVDCPYSDEELLATGWFHKKRSGDPVPTFADRIVFPYWRDGVVRYAIGREFFGRAKRSDVSPGYYDAHPYDSGKYKKIPVHSEKFPWISGYVKNDVLWGEDCLRRVRGDEPLHVTEGVTDAGMLALLGFHVISPVTVAFRDQDVERVIALIRRHHVKRVVILNDNDTTPDGKHPGLDGAKKMAIALWRAGIDVRIGRLPKPDSASKIDVNEIGAAAIRAGGEEHAKAALKAISDGALAYPAFLVSELPPKMTNEELEPHLRELGALAERMTNMQRSDLELSVCNRYRNLPKRLALKVFGEALHKERQRRIAAEEAAAEAAPVAAAPADAERAAGGAAPGEAAAPAREGETPPAASGGGGGRFRLHGGAVLESPDGFYERRIDEETREAFSTFALQVLKLVIPPDAGAPLFCVRVVGRAPGKHLKPPVLVAAWTIPTKAWNGRRAFIAAFPHNGMAWTGSDDEVQGLAALLYRESAGKVPVVRSTNVLGRHVAADGSPRFVLPAGVLDPGGWMANPDLVFLPEGGSNLTHRLPAEPLPLDDPEALALAKEALSTVCALHETEPMATMAFWMMATLFGPALRAELGSFAILNVVGSPGTGKSSLLARVLWPMFAGVTWGELLSCTSSVFAFTKDFSAANALAVILDEFKPGDMGPKAVEVLYRFARRAYSGDTETRGRADQDVNTYRLDTCLCIAGEARLEHDQAIAERCVLAQMDGTWLRAHPDATAHFEALVQKPLWKVAPLLQAWSVRADVADVFARARTLLRTTLAGLGRTDLPERVRKNLLLVAVGAVGLDDAATAFGADIGEVPFAAVVKRILRDTFDEDDTTGPATRVRSNFDTMFLEASHAAQLGIVAEGKLYVWVDQRLRLWLPGIEAALEEWRRSRGLPSHSPGARALKRIANEMMRQPGAYVTAVDKQTQFGDDRRPYCIEIDPHKVPASLGAESFPATTEKTWGGTRVPSTTGGPPPRRDRDREPN